MRLFSIISVYPRCPSSSKGFYLFTKLLYYIISNHPIINCIWQLMHQLNRWLLSAAAVIWTQETGIFLSRHLWWSKFLHVLNSLFRSPTVGCWLAWSPAQRGSVCVRSTDPREEASLHFQYDPHSAPRLQEAEALRRRCFAVTIAFFFFF